MERAIAVVIAVLLVIGLLTQWNSGGGRNSAEPATQFQLKDLEGNVVDLADYKGQVVLLDFWATWCGPCRAEIPNVKALHTRYASEGLVIVGLSLDRDVKTLKDYMQKNGVTWQMVYLGNNTKIAQDYGVRAIPSMFVIDRDGKLRYSKVRGQEAARAVEQLLKEQPQGS